MEIKNLIGIAVNSKTLLITLALTLPLNGAWADAFSGRTPTVTAAAGYGASDRGAAGKLELNLRDRLDEHGSGAKVKLELQPQPTGGRLKTKMNMLEGKILDVSQNDQLRQKMDLRLKVLEGEIQGDFGGPTNSATRGIFKPVTAVLNVKQNDSLFRLFAGPAFGLGENRIGETEDDYGLVGAVAGLEGNGTLVQFGENHRITLEVLGEIYGNLGSSLDQHMAGTASAKVRWESKLADGGMKIYAGPEASGSTFQIKATPEHSREFANKNGQSYFTGGSVGIEY